MAKNSRRESVFICRRRGEGGRVMLQPIEAAERIRAVAQSTDLPMSAMLDDVAKLLDQVDDSGNYCAARIAELEADRDRLAAIVEQIPTTKDGVRVGIADRVFSYEPSAGKVVARVPIGKGGSFTTCLAEIASLTQSWGVPSYREVSECYSTREAAEAPTKETK